MKLSYAWLKEWVDVPWDARELGSRLTMAGFELEGMVTNAHDCILELNVTPNRGDVMSVLGFAREVAALSLSLIHIWPTKRCTGACSRETMP